jgi:hypothetical protein
MFILKFPFNFFGWAYVILVGDYEYVALDFLFDWRFVQKFCLDQTPQ